MNDEANVTFTVRQTDGSPLRLVYGLWTDDETQDDGPTLPPAPVSGPSNPAIEEDEQAE